jgi:hypothetical protein
MEVESFIFTIRFHCQGCEQTETLKKCCEFFVISLCELGYSSNDFLLQSVTVLTGEGEAKLETS